MGNTSPMEAVRMDLEYSFADSDQQHAPETASTTQTQRTIKKRTKTGCLTCRQRRIKCGEEKPVCNNCIKSKRDCKGYAQRLVFKNPLGPPESSSSQHIFDVQTQSVPLGPSSVGYGGPAFSQQRPSGSQPILAPMPMVSASYQAPSSSVYLPNEAIQESGPGSMPISYPVPRHEGQFPASHTPVTPAFPPYTQLFTPSQDGLGDRSSHYAHNPGPDFVSSGGSALQVSTSINPGISYRDAPQNELSSLQTLETNPVSHPDSANVSQYTNEDWPPSVGPPMSREQQESHFSRHSVSSGPPTHLIHGDEEDDDCYDVGTDEDQASVQDFNHMGLIVASANQDEWRLRSFTTYLNEPNILTSYQPSLGSSPLNNPKTARIFLHFIHSTGPSLSVYERRPVDPSTMLGTRVPAAQQGLWTYTLPLKALENQALLQAILALSSLHISLLQQDSPAVSLKHYHYALKRVGVAVGLPTRRKQIGTLAATLLLAYYEVMSADHYKWNSHVAGSAHLIREIGFAKITRDLRAHRRRALTQRASAPPHSHTYPYKRGAWEDDPFAEQEMSVDDDIVGLLLGRAINYDDIGQVDNDLKQPRQQYFTPKDIETFRIQCDLYWWFCKQDAFQSIISGNRLFMPYSLWGQCPPRAGLGRLDAIYGSADHIWLLLARLADFGYRDRKRKLTAVKSTGSEWRPDAGFFNFIARFAGSGTASGHPPYGGNQSGPNPGHPHSEFVARDVSDSQQSKVSSSFSRPKEAPPMYGMAPSSMPRRLPPSFAESAPRDNSGTQDHEDTELSYNEAEHEWEEIRAALDTFEQALGPDFSPLPPDSAPPISTPFGPALQYRTNTIAVLWSYYYTGRILLHRLHPSMPPAMMMAAGVAAPTTADLSQAIGKIAGGVYYPQSFHLETGHLSPTLGSCLIEVTVPIFFAAVQYTDITQRIWVATKLRDVSRLTGWKTSDAMAQGCETFWRMSAKSGRGPPYDAPCSRTPGQPRGYVSQTNHNPERRFVAYDPAGSAGWAKGIMSLEADLVDLDIADQK